MLPAKYRRDTALHALRMEERSPAVFSIIIAARAGKSFKCIKIGRRQLELHAMVRVNASFLTFRAKHASACSLQRDHLQKR